MELRASYPLQRLLDGCTQLKTNYGLRVSDPGHLSTKRCCKRGCHWCDYRLRARHLKKLNRLERLVQKEPEAWRFETYTLPGDLFEIRGASLSEQLEVFRRAKKRFRKRRGGMTSSYVIEHTKNSTSGNWHLHSHDLVASGEEYSDFNGKVNELTKKWLQCVDKSTTNHLLNFDVPLEVIGGRAIDVQRVSDSGLASYMSKATRYMTKGSSVQHDRDCTEVSSAMYGKHVFGTTGSLWGTKYGRM